MMIKEDNVESIFLQIMKDNGLGGLKDIKAIKNITIKNNPNTTIGGKNTARLLISITFVNFNIARIIVVQNASVNKLILLSIFNFPIIIFLSNYLSYLQHIPYVPRNSWHQYQMD